MTDFNASPGNVILRQWDAVLHFSQCKIYHDKVVRSVLQNEFNQKRLPVGLKFSIFFGPVQEFRIFKVLFRSENFMFGPDTVRGLVRLGSGPSSAQSSVGSDR